MIAHNDTTAQYKTLTNRLIANVPQELHALDQWVTWRFETRQGQSKPTKVLYNPATGKRAESDNAATWATFANACAAYERGGYDGLGFVVTEDDPYVGVDIDGCIVNGELTDDASRWVAHLDSYTEVTPSRKGVRIWVRGVKPGDRCKNPKASVEIYQAERFFTVTGQRLEALPATIKSRQKELTALYNELFPQEQAPVKALPPRLPADVAAIPQDDQELLQRMFSAKNGAAIRALWNGSAAANNGDASAADLALCNHLAFWTGCDEQRMDRLFRQSGLMRPKWDRKVTGDTSYSAYTIRNAAKKCAATYDPKRRSDTSIIDAPTPAEDPAAVVESCRQWIKANSFLPYIDPALLPDGGLRNEMTLRRVADAILDLLEEYKSLGGFLSLREIRRRAGCGIETARNAMARLMPWFVDATDPTQERQEGAALHYTLTFRVNGTPIYHKGDDGGGCPDYAKSPFTLHKAADAFNVGGNRDMRNAALCYVLGRPAVDLLVQLEGYDQPRRDAWADYRAAQTDMAAKGDALTAADVAVLDGLADGLIDEPQPVTLAALEHLRDYAQGIKTLADLGAIFLAGDTVCLSPDYAKPINAQVASLGPTALLMIDTSVARGDLAYDEFSQYTGLKYGTLHRAMSKLLKREIYQDDRDGMTKRFSLRADWLSEVEALAHTMRTYGLQQKRAIADAEDQYLYVGVQMATAQPEEQPKLRRRQERAFNRLLAAVAMDDPSLTQDRAFALGLRSHLESKRTPQAPDMQEPGALSWQRLCELTGRGILTPTEYEEAAKIANLVGADISRVQWALEDESTPAMVDARYPLSHLAVFDEEMSRRHGAGWTYRLHPAMIDARYREFSQRVTTVGM